MKISKNWMKMMKATPRNNEVDEGGSGW